MRRGMHIAELEGTVSRSSGIARKTALALVRCSATAEPERRAGAPAPARPRRAKLDALVVFRGPWEFDEAGTLTFRCGSTLTYATRRPGSIDAGDDTGERHGAAVLEITGGTGAYAGACGRLASSFLLAPGGSISDVHVGVVRGPRTPPI